MYIHIVLLSKHNSSRFSKPKNANPRRFPLTEHSFSFRPFPFPRDSLAFPVSSAVVKILQTLTISRRCETGAESAFGVHRRIRRGKAPRSDNGSLTSPLSRLRASIHTFLPFPSCLLRCRLAPVHKAITTRR